MKERFSLSKFSVKRRLCREIPNKMFTYKKNVKKAFFCRYCAADEA